MTENYPDSLFEEAAKREAENVLIAKVSDEDYQKVLDAIKENKALESLGIEYGDFEGEDDVDYEAPNGDYIKSYPLINRVEVIGKNGREFVQYDCSNVQVSQQDNGRTLKVFLS